MNAGAPAWGRFDLALTAEFSSTLAHRCQPNTGSTAYRKTYPIVRDLYVEHIKGIVEPQAHSAGLRPRMADHVGQRLLNDTIRCHFDGCRQMLELLRSLDL